VQKAKVKMTGFPKPPVFDDKYKEREYLKGRLAAAFRIFGKNGYDEGILPTAIIYLPSGAPRLTPQASPDTSPCATRSTRPPSG
jgi:hypothetical protein